VSLGAVRHNVRALLGRCPPGVRLFAVVKANAYGHGAVPVSEAALEAGAWGLAVARVEEGLELRRAGLSAPVLVQGHATEGELPEALANDLTVSISGWQTALALSSLALETGRVALTHLKVDTGMRRYGVELADAPRFVEALSGLPGVRLEGLYTHFATADEPHSPVYAGQLRQFRELVGGLEAAGLRPPIVHAANSAAVARDPESTFDAVRTGIALYGVEPAPDVRLDVTPAMSVKAVVARVLDVGSGDGVSYGHTYLARSSHRAAVVAAGYADGYIRSLSNRGEALIRGRRRRVLGRVCMDSLVVDLGDDREVASGDEAVLLGSQGEERVTVEELGERAGTIAYEVLCGLDRRSRCVYTP
jgi:alanine racemase